MRPFRKIQASHPRRCSLPVALFLPTLLFFLLFAGLASESLRATRTGLRRPAAASSASARQLQPQSPARLPGWDPFPTASTGSPPRSRLLARVVPERRIGTLPTWTTPVNATHDLWRSALTLRPQKLMVQSSGSRGKWYSGARVGPGGGAGAGGARLLLDWAEFPTAPGAGAEGAGSLGARLGPWPRRARLQGCLSMLPQLDSGRSAESWSAACPCQGFGGRTHGSKEGGEKHLSAPRGFERFGVDESQDRGTAVWKAGLRAPIHARPAGSRPAFLLHLLAPWGTIV